MTTTLVLGGARSGKSAHAEALASASGREVVYIATARPGRGDSEMAQRIAHHREGRPAHWTTIEEPAALGATITQWSAPARVVLVDCLTLWLSNLLFSGADAFPETGVITLPPLFYAQRQALLDALASATGDVVLVSNEVGMGIVPMGAVSRAFVDEQGRLNQAVAAACDRAVFVAAGLPIFLKRSSC
jgi:adenosylcobinamide kinase/adenosylcobinamide-phosphate guanylyltransferase